MYDYRHMTESERSQAVEYRRARHQPWHAPSHGELGFTNQFFITSACYEHAPIIGKLPARIAECEEQLLSVCREYSLKTHAWCVLPNHYHVLVKTDQIKELCEELGRFHGRSSFIWNGEDEARGRQVWYRCFDREIRSERHFWASVNYIHHNPIHHGYAEKWEEWPWSSASEYLRQIGREEAVRIWQKYPILDYGKGWDA